MAVSVSEEGGMHQGCPQGAEPQSGASPGGLGAVDGLQVVEEPVVLGGAGGVVDVGGQEDVVGGAHVHLQAGKRGFSPAWMARQHACLTAALTPRQAFHAQPIAGMACELHVC